tara:strand:- start:1344 stop:2993 length:1650 start_codon:yes stop_codon:yes gene_type:complete
MNNNLTKSINYKNKKIAVINFFITHKRTFIILIFVFLYLLFYFLIDFSTQSLVAHDEGLYARRSRLIEESYNWFSSPFPTPHHKTVGSYWFIALSIRLFGNSEFALRLPSVISSFLCLLISYLIALRISNKKSALISIFSLSSMPLWIQYSRYASPDFPFVLCILLVILFFLKFIETKIYKNKYFYIFIAGIFISIAFFIRSYMVFIPLVGLTPFFVYHLLKTNNYFRSIFFTGILIGSIPTLINLYFSYQKFGSQGITSLFVFARKQVIEGVFFDNLFITPLNFIYFTFPTGILFITLLILTTSRYKIKYALLMYFYPLISLFILLCMSTSYPHYYLFLLPSLSMLFAIKLDFYSYRFSLSKNIIKYLFICLIILIVITVIAFTFYFGKYIIINFNEISNIKYIISSFFFFTFLLSLRYILDTKGTQFNLTKFFYNLIIPQYISLSLLFNFGIIGNPNPKIKAFLNDNLISSIVRYNTIYIYNVDSKFQTLLSYYLPSSQVIKSSENIKMYDYVITSDRQLLTVIDKEPLFKAIKKFDDNFLLKNISK